MEKQTGPTINKSELPKCTLTDEQLGIKASLWLDKLIKPGGKAFTMQVPVNVNNDTDMIFYELIARFSELAQSKEKLLKVTEEMNLLLDKLEQKNNSK